MKSNKFLRRFWEAFWRPEMLVLPGQVAFFLFLSIVPTITIIGYACAYLNVSNTVISTLISNTLGVSYSEMLTPILTNTQITPYFFITLGVGYFIASNGMASIIVASNTIYGIKDSGFFNRRVKAIIMEVILVLLFLFIIVVPLLGNNIINLLHYFNMEAESKEFLVQALQFIGGPLSWLIIFIFIKLMYTLAPDRKIPSHNVNGGAIFTTIAWVGITTVYSYYIDHFANYSVFYGTLANIVILMMWVYLLAYAFVIGMAMNYHEELEKTGVIKVKKAIEESANSASVYPEEAQKKKGNKKEVEEQKKDTEVLEQKKERKAKKK